MINISDKQFNDYVAAGIDAIPKTYSEHLQNVAFIVEDGPSEQQKTKLGVRYNQLLLGLYEGIPLPQRNSDVKILPDKITLFKNPLLSISADTADLKDKINKTIWHEVAHYYGLGHKRIHELGG